jgi:cytochrome c553
MKSASTARWLMLGAVLAVPQLARSQVSPANTELLFETKVRPALAENCWKCHGADKQSSGLRLDTRDFALKGGGLGPAVVPGKPEESLLWTAIRHEDETLRMPSKSEKLPDDVIEAVGQWITAGAPWPAGGASIDSPDQAAKRHWAFQPLFEFRPPQLDDALWSRNPIDAFVLEQLAARDIAPSGEADRRSLIRRVTYDLLGLPPSADDVERFEADSRPDAYERLADRLLASPGYGERWGRRWLDVARYADTKGYVFQEERRYPFAYTYRDYVVDAFNTDLPFDQFVKQQIAADQLPRDPADNQSLAALGFLTVGRRFLNDANDIIDDRIDVVTRGMLGLTVSCARCHDHKYDPIPSEDYYSLYGVFASSIEPPSLPALGTNGPELDAQATAYEKERTEKSQALETFLAEKRSALESELREKALPYLIAAHELEFNPRHQALDTIVRERGLRTPLLRLVMRRWKDPLAGVASGRGIETAKFARAVKDADPALLAVADNEVRRLLNPDERNKFRDLERARDQVDVTHPGSPPRAMVIVDRETPVEPRVFLRGDPARPGEQVPRRFLKVLSGESRPTFAHGSGRLELAESIASPANPLTARVIVNRVWQGHFGRGLVTTPSDFGLRSEQPSHHALLDWLTGRFISEGWSVKVLHRRIVLSSTYRQRSDLRPQLAQIDPDNRLLARRSRQRLDFEAMRDSVLTVSGALELTIGGRPVPLVENRIPARRTLYGFVDRQNLAGVYRTFDFPNPDASSPGRFETVVPQQALFLMNSPFILDRARAIGRRVSMSTDQVGEQIRTLYRHVLGRAPEPDEENLGREFLEHCDAAGQDAKQLDPLAQYAQILMLSNEFMYVD